MSSLSHAPVLIHLVRRHTRAQRIAIALFCCLMALTAGCTDTLRVASPGVRTGSEAPPPAPGVAEEEAPLEVAATAPRVLRVPVGAATAGEPRVWWLQDSQAFRSQVPDVDLRLRSNVGRDVGVVRLGDSLLLVDRHDGVLGAARVDLPSWYGVLGNDTLLVSINRDLYRADVAGALAGDWEYLGSHPDAIAWDVAGDSFVLATPWAVYNSSDGGRTVTEVLKAPAGQEFVNTEVRSDGVIAALAYDRAYVAHMHVSADYGKQWREAPVTLPGLDRVGARLQYADPSGCAWALADDAQHWVRSDTWDASASWNRLGLLASRPRWRSSAALATVGEPPAPTWRKGAEVTGAPTCTAGARADELEPLGELPASFPATLARWFAEAPAPVARCTVGGLGCLVRAAAPQVVPGRSDYGFLSDGVCTPDASGDCSTPSELPTLVRWNRDTGHVEVLALPPGCRVPLEAFGARGLGVLSCLGADDAGVEIYVASDRASFSHELSVAAAGGLGWAQAADGTLALYAQCAGTRGLCGVWVRDSVPVDEAATWSAHDIDDLVALRVLPGGRLLAVSSAQAAGVPRDEAAAAATFTLALHEPGEGFWGERFVLLSDKRLEQPVHDIEVADDGRLIFVSEANGARQLHTATREGELRAPTSP